jgi:hypothetical protein
MLYPRQAQRSVRCQAYREIHTELDGNAYLTVGVG